MPLQAVFRDIRAARCTINDRGSFLRDLLAIGSGNDTHIVCFNADMIAGRVHAHAATAQATRAFESGTNISNTLEMEALLYAAGSRQCNIASSFGIHDGENRIYICCSPVREGIWAMLEPLFHFSQENWDTINEEKQLQVMKTFSISPEEITAAGGDNRIVDLVLERVALLQVMR
jgi:KEOPS complex subunit Cgi121